MLKRFDKIFTLISQKKREEKNIIDESKDCSNTAQKEVSS